MAVNKPWLLANRGGISHVPDMHTYHTAYLVLLTGKIIVKYITLTCQVLLLLRLITDGFGTFYLV